MMSSGNRKTEHPSFRATLMMYVAFNFFSSSAKVKGNAGVKMKKMQHEEGRPCLKFYYDDAPKENKYNFSQKLSDRTAKKFTYGPRTHHLHPLLQPSGSQPLAVLHREDQGKILH